MPYSVFAEEPIKIGRAMVWDGGIFSSYEEALLAAAKYMFVESLDFGGNPDVSIDMICSMFEIEADKEEKESYIEWIHRSTGENIHDIELPYLNSEKDLYLKDIETNKNIHCWSGITIFHPTKGLCTVWHP